MVVPVDGFGRDTRFSRRVGLSFATAAAISCGRQLRDERELTTLVQSEPSHLDPRFPTDALSAYLSRLVYRSLVDVDPHTLAYRNSLAASVRMIDPLNTHVTIRDDVQFHDGSRLTADDVTATYRGLMDPQVGSPVRSITAMILASVRTIDARTVAFELREPSGILPLVMAQPIVKATDAQRREIVAEPGNERAFVGTGPMRVASLERNAWRFTRAIARPHSAQSLRFLTVKDANTMALRLLHQRADVAEIKPELFPLFRDRPGFTFARARGVACVYLPMRNDHRRLSQLIVRQAIAHAIDREALVRGKFGGLATPATGILPPWHWAYEGDVQKYAYDPSRARAMLDQAWPAGERRRESLIFRCSNQRFTVTTASAITEMLRAVGLSVELRPSELSVLLADLRAGRFDLSMMQAPDVAEPHILWTLFATAAQPTPSAPRAGLNRWRFSDAALDRAVVAGSRAQERAERAGFYATAQRVLAERLPVIPLWHPDVIFVGAPRVQGLVTRGDARFDPLLDVNLRGL
ncbi:MAG: ABC transporter substrate-binding protein [Deltaproteobacteria bacterium]|nr:ABC transporter substrate-binding protein [Deltaproteobacteria bacterium]